MKFYPLLLAALILNLLLFLPLSSELYKTSRSDEPDESVFDMLDSRGIGPYSHRVDKSLVLVDGPDYSGPAVGYTYITYYQGNIVINSVLAVMVILACFIETRDTK